MNIFFDTEFTDLTQNSQLISIALVSDCGKMFYAVFDDWDIEKCSDFVKNEVLTNLDFSDINLSADCTQLKGNKAQIVRALTEWLAQFDAIQMWADVSHYDWVFFCELFGGALHIPQQIHYMCLDLATLILSKGFDIDKKRVELLAEYGISPKFSLHNALSDAQIGMQLLKILLKK